MELVNGPDFYEEAYPWIAQRKLTILATSDGHDPLPPRSTGFRRPVTLLFVRSADAEGVREALDARRVVRLRRTLADYAAQQRSPARALRIDLVTLTLAAAAWRVARWPGIDQW